MAHIYILNVQQHIIGSVLHFWILGAVLGFGNVRGTCVIYDGGVVPPPPPPPEPPKPEPDPGEGDIDDKNKFPWVLYANKLRNK